MKIDDKVIYVPRDKIIAGPWQPRRHFDEAGLIELAASIKEHGILTPLVVSAAGYVYHLIAGERRLRAAAMADLAELPCRVVYSATDDELRRMAIIDNLHREDLRPGEEALAVKTLSETGMKQHDIAAALGKSQAWVSQRIGLTRLPEKVLQDVDNGVITVEDARELTKLVKHPELMAMVVDRSTPGRREYLGDWHYDEGRSVASRVKDILDVHSRKVEVENKRLELEKEGKTVIRSKEPDGDQYIPIDDWRTEGTFHKNAGLTCVAYYVTEYGRALPYCTDPAGLRNAMAQAQQTGDGLTAEQLRERKQKANQKLREQAQDAAIAAYVAAYNWQGIAGDLQRDLGTFAQLSLHNTLSSEDARATVGRWLGISGTVAVRAEKVNELRRDGTPRQLVMLWMLGELYDHVGRNNRYYYNPTADKEVAAWLASIGYIDPCPPETLAETFRAETEPEDMEPEEEEDENNIPAEVEA